MAEGGEAEHVHLVADGGVEGTVAAWVVQGDEDELVHLAEAGTVVCVAQGGEAEHVHLVADGGVEGTVDAWVVQGDEDELVHLAEAGPVVCVDHGVAALLELVAGAVPLHHEETVSIPHREESVSI